MSETSTLDPPPAAAGRTEVVRLESVSRTFPGDPPTEALRAAQLSVHAGELLTVVGPSGSGKSTLLNVLGLLDRPTGGVYRLNGTDVSELRESQRTALRGREIGFVFQSFQLLVDRSALDNVAMGTLYLGMGARQTEALCHEALERVGLAHKALQVPSHMSGGERQRVAVARAVVTDPSLLLCDEPTGNLDSRSSSNIAGLFQELNRDGATIIVITHDAEIAKIGTRTIRISDGMTREVRADEAS